MQLSLSQLFLLLTSVPLSLAAAISPSTSKTTILGGTTTVLPPFTYTVIPTTHSIPARTFTGSGKHAGQFATRPARAFTVTASTGTDPARTMKYLPTTMVYLYDEAYEKKKPANMDIRVWHEGGEARMLAQPG